MRNFQFNRNKYNTELLIDCLSIKEIQCLSTALKEIHTTSFYEIYFFDCVNGSIKVEDEIFELSGTNIVLLPPLLSRTWDVEFNKDSYVVFFDEDVFENVLKDTSFLYRLHYFGYKNNKPILPVEENLSTVYCPILGKVIQEFSNLKSDSNVILSSYLYQLLLEINRQYSDHYNLDRNLEIDSEIIRFRSMLKSHVSYTRTVTDYASLMGVTRNRLNTLSLKLYGKNANLVIRNELLLACKNELLSSSSSISEISHQFNFSAPSNFTRFFKSLEGLSPVEYRDKFKN